MAQRNRSAFKSLYGASGTQFPDNTTGDITALIQRTFGEDDADSFFNLLDDWPVARQNILTNISVDTTTAPISIDLSSASIANFYGSADIGAAKTWALANATNGIRFDMKFKMTTLDIQTFPSTFKMPASVLGWDTTNHQWTPSETGIYLMTCIYDNTEWLMTINGPFI